MQQLSEVTFQQAADGIFWLDHRGQVHRANEAICRLLGYSLEELLAMKVPDFDPLTSAAGYVEHWQEVKKHKRFSFETQLRTRDRRIIPVEVLSNFVEFEGKEYCCSFVHDITERRKREEELEDLRRRLQEENLYLQEEIRVEHNFGEIVGQSKVFKKVLRRIEQVAPTDTTVLILGETGTGKELLARAVHDLSSRKDRPLVKVNCAALPSNLIESELFGHEKGAFTGALSRRVGRFELADRGTIFLDEVGDLPMELQTKLLRVLQEGEFERVGGTTTLKVNVRVIAATNRDLEKAMEEGNFREDLYYRLNVFPITSPPLRERREDLPPLVHYFVRKYGPKMGKKIEAIPQRVMDSLLAYHWPGNIRELENIIERSLIISSGKQLDLEDCFRRPRGAQPSGFVSLAEVERKYICEVLEATNWRISGEKGAAKILEINSKTLDSRMKKLGIERKSVRS